MAFHFLQPRELPGGILAKDEDITEQKKRESPSVTIFAAIVIGTVLSLAFMCVVQNNF